MKKVVFITVMSMCTIYPAPRSIATVDHDMTLRASQKKKRAKLFIKRCISAILTGIVALHCAPDEEKRKEAFMHMVSQIESLINAHALSNEEINKYIDVINTDVSKMLVDTTMQEHPHILPE